jgi:hypothetical protein
MKINETMFKLPIDCYCGVFLEKRLAKRVISLLKKQNDELKKILIDNIDETHSQNWTLAYDKKKKQYNVDFIQKSDTKEDKMRRINLLDKCGRMETTGNLFFKVSSEFAEAMEEAQKEAEEQLNEKH